MKNSIRNFTLLSLAFLLVQVTFAQTDVSNALSYVDTPTKSTVKHVTPAASSNEQIVLNTLVEKVTNKLQWPESFESYYNSDITVLVSFTISKKGILKDVKIVEEKGNLVEELVKKEFSKVQQVGPVISNGKVQNKRYFLPVIFEAQK